uniref:Uncharacterized protein n=1 Tax=Trypanosoma congolense (strain IL3000) TaxID=1068625 RepID=G0URY1_TRYCI|nr:hypothetical protein, unlikely [Trypanosoma congolense IL3000]
MVGGFYKLFFPLLIPAIGRFIFFFSLPFVVLLQSFVLPLSFFKVCLFAFAVFLIAAAAGSDSLVVFRFLFFLFSFALETYSLSWPRRHFFYFHFFIYYFFKKKREHPL